MDKNKQKNSPEFSQPKQTKAKPKFILKKWHKIILAIFLLFILLPAGAVLAFEQLYSEKIYPGIKIGEIDLGGQTKAEAALTLKDATRFFNEEGVVFVYQNKKASLVPILTAANDPDLSRTIFTLENDKTIEEAFALGRNNEFRKNLKNQISFLIFGQKIPLVYRINSPEMKAALEENFGYLETPEKNAGLKIVSTSPKISFEVSPEQEGLTFNYDSAIELAFSKVAELDKTPIPLTLAVKKPQIRKDETALLPARAEKLAKLCSITLGETKKVWVIPQSKITDWLEIQMVPQGLTVGLNKEKTEDYLKTLASEINTLPQDAKLTIENGKVKEFKIHQGGKELNIEASYNQINDYITNFDETKLPNSCPKNLKPDESETIQLIVKITAPQIPIGSLNNLGIQELVGVGESDFSGSPVNRRHNIRTGAAKLNGVLIAPGEEFSTNKTLGDVSGATGYLPELVIKGDKTIPEYGGGLCQIGTTMFRVALDAGLPITERRPHSYRVVYYEPAGMDATIYSPKPDLKFINDTPAYLLLQTKIDGDNLTFELWGTSDGRKTEISKPKVYNFVGPGPTKIVETEDLPPGEKKCTERAHTGADAEFSRTVTFTNGEVKTETWTSHYVPWAAVCLVGKEPTAPPTEGTPLPDGMPADPALAPTQDANTNNPSF